MWSAQLLVKEKSNRGLSAVYGGSIELAAQDEQADDLATGEVFSGSGGGGDGDGGGLVAASALETSSGSA